MVWNDPEVKELAERFIPAADQCDRLQSGKEPDSLLFQKFADRGHSREPGATRQGTYVATPSGILLSSVNSPDPEKILKVLRGGLERWERLSREERLLPAPPDPGLGDRGRRSERKCPPAGLILHVYCRDLPREGIPPRWQGAWNQDFAWFRKEEARALLSPEPRKGARHEAPAALVERLARLHLLDSVRAGTEPFPPQAVREARLASTVADIDGEVVSLSFEGSTRTSEEGKVEVRGAEEIALKQARGFEARLLGRARYDLKAERYLSFELLAVGNRWGATSCNLRTNNNDLAASPMGVLLVLAGERPSERVPPAFLSHYGWR